MSENNELENFVDRVSTHSNRRKLTIVSQTPDEIIADVSRFDTEVTQQGTKISASDLQDIVDKVNDLETKIGQENGSYIYVNNEFQSQVNFTSNPQTQIDNIWDKIYPVGSIYMSTSTTSPATLFGGTWEQIHDRFLLSSSDSYPLGEIGGEASHTLSVNEMPNHNHSQISHSHETNTTSKTLTGEIYCEIDANGTTGALGNGIVSRGSTQTCSGTAGTIPIGCIKIDATHTHTTNSVAPTINAMGGGQAHNNMPPYLVVNMWKRTA